MRPTKYVALDHFWSGGHPGGQSQWSPRLSVLKGYPTADDKTMSVAIFEVTGRMSNPTAIAVVTEWLYRGRPTSMTVSLVHERETPVPPRPHPKAVSPVHEAKEEARS